MKTGIYVKISAENDYWLKANIQNGAKSKLIDDFLTGMRCQYHETEDKKIPELKQEIENKRLAQEKRERKELQRLTEKFGGNNE